MPVRPDESPVALPDRPDLRHLRDEARQLQRAGTTSLSAAQLRVARRYGFPSWPRLKVHVEALGAVGELKTAIDQNDLSGVRRLMTRRPQLHSAPLGYRNNGPLTWVAECRVPREAPSPARLAMAAWMIEHGSDVHQGGDGPLMRAALHDNRVPMMALLVERGADVNARWNDHYPIVCAPCEALAPRALRWLLEHGADPQAIAEPYGTDALAMVVCTYMRDAPRKQSCLAALVDWGMPVPDTPTMALHRGRVDLIADHLARDAALLGRRFSEAEIYPPEIGLRSGEGLHGTPIAGVSLLHLAVEYGDVALATWLLERGADPNARADVDADGFGGHTPLFHTVVSLVGGGNDVLARLLLAHGADPNARASLRRQLRDTGDPENESLRTIADATPIVYATQFAEPAWVNEPAIAAIREREGRA